MDEPMLSSLPAHTERPSEDTDREQAVVNAEGKTPESTMLAHPAQMWKTSNYVCAVDFFWEGQAAQHINNG